MLMFQLAMGIKNVEMRKKLFEQDDLTLDTYYLSLLCQNEIEK
jgi:hypothetical protein